MKFKIVLFLCLSFLIFLYAAFRPPPFYLLRDKVEIPIFLANGEPSTLLVGPKAPGWVPLSLISPHLIHAVISSEDGNFYSHQGIDMFELKKAFEADMKAHQFKHGGSTITQQLIKNVFLSPKKTLTRKIREIFWALLIEKKLSKKEILEFYINMVEWGPGMYGVLKASQVYFQKSPMNLTPKEGAFLAMLLPSPRRYYSYFKNKYLTAWAEKRVNHILFIMEKTHFLSEEEYTTSYNQKLWGHDIIQDSKEDMEEEEKSTEADDGDSFFIPDDSKNIDNNNNNNNKENDREEKDEPSQSNVISE